MVNREKASTFLKKFWLGRRTIAVGKYFITLARGKTIASKCNSINLTIPQLFDMAKMNAKYGFYPYEYCVYRFDKLSMKERLSFVPDKLHGPICAAMNPSLDEEIFDNKYMTYRLFNNYYNRDVIDSSGGVYSLKILPKSIIGLS